MTTRMDIDKANAGYPWRRFLARGIDYSLYSLLWYTVAYFILRWNISEWTFRNLFIMLALAILIEPFMLRFWGTTPGKAIFGIRIRNKMGENLTLEQGYGRIWGVFAYGYGYWIPIYNIVRMYKSYKACKVNNLMEWDCHWSGDFQYTISHKMLPLRALVYIVVFAMLGVAGTLMPFAADMPRHRGEISGEQFLENVDRYARFHRIMPVERVPEAYRFDRPSPPELTIIETNGVVTEISFEIVDGDFVDTWGLYNWVRAYVVSFVGAQEGVNFWNLHIARGNVMREFFPHIWINWAFSNHSHTAHGIEMIYEFDTDWNVFPRVVNVRFIMRKL